MIKEIVAYKNKLDIEFNYGHFNYCGIFPPDIGGPASFVPKIAKYLINKGHNVKIICLSDKEHLTYKDDINVIRINRNSPIIFRWLKTIVKIYSNSKKRI